MRHPVPFLVLAALLATLLAVTGCGKSSGGDGGGADGGTGDGCQPQCGNQQCGLDPVCNLSCGDCGAGRCVAGTCVCPDPYVCGEECCSDGQICKDGACCTPDCSTLRCGPDPLCGISCGECGSGDCMAGQCACPSIDLTCGDTCCDLGQVCKDGACCTPDCGAVQCGPDPTCGTDCGGCMAPRSCQEGQCRCPFEECSGLCCGTAGEVCKEGLCCVMDCTGRTCGFDPVCEGSCGDCEQGERCTDDGSECVPAAGVDWERDILHTGLVLDVTELTGRATLRIAQKDSSRASFRVDGLTVTNVTDADGVPVDWEVQGLQLDVGVPRDRAPEIVVDYSFNLQPRFQGYTGVGISYTWPTFCGNLFPCFTRPHDGVLFSLHLTGVPPGETAVYPEQTLFEGPSYMLAFVHGAYTEKQLGTTDAGTRLSVWYLAGNEAPATAGTANLLRAFDWYEKTLGPYPYGDAAASVEADWGNAPGGMEHHPMWHVASLDMGNEEIHIHEATHGWFGNGVRMACWEDFVFSEGTVVYLVARAFREVIGEQAEADLWTGYRARLTAAMDAGDRNVLPDTCDASFDIVAEGLANDLPYIKGALFYKAVADSVGVETLDGVLASFFLAHRGQAVRMQDMLDHIAAETPLDPTDLAQEWLRTPGIPPQ